LAIGWVLGCTVLPAGGCVEPQGDEDAGTDARFADVDGDVRRAEGDAASGPCGVHSERRPARFSEEPSTCPLPEPADEPPARDPDVKLHASDCDGLLARIQEAAIARMEATLEANLAAALRGDGCWDYVDYGPCDEYDYGGWADSAADYGGGGDGGTTPPGPEEYSETNNQVPGVDEADFLKTDGQYVYLVSHGKLRILDAWPPEEARVVSTHPVEGEPTALFYWRDRAVVYSALGAGSGGYDSRPCTYGYDCDFVGDGRDAKITVFDVGDRASPRVVRELRFNGSYINSRRIEGAVFTVLQVPVAGMPVLPSWPEALPRCPDGWSRCEVRRAFASLADRNRAAIRAARIDAWIASMTDTRYDAGVPRTTTRLLVDCAGTYVSDLSDGRDLLVVAAFDALASNPPALATVLARPGAVYATRDGLYVAARQHAGDGGVYDPAADFAGDFTTVHRFALDAARPAATYAATGVVEGRVLNQFSLDEYEGNLRIATTSGHLPSPDVHSTIAVLESRGATLEVIGRIDDIAPTEDIRAVRFDGTRGFVVTFKKTDPLFALDLADPAHPRIAGELHIPGYSTYMHRMDDTHLLTIGYDADDMGSFAWFDRIQLQIFDVSDLSSPTLLHREVIGTRGSTSDAATDHLAFNYFPPREALAIPMVICEGGGDGTYGSLTFSGLLVYRVRTSTGFDLLGRVAHADPAGTGYAACANWWTDSNSPVKRSIFMDDYVFSIATDALKVVRLDDMGRVLAEARLDD
jgi:uncharacterized secreted protein with C-terminal beta-propeller domain